MLLRNLVAFFVGFALLSAPVAATAADCGPSTPEERKQALEYIQDFEANPLGPNEAREREWVIEWIIEVPDIHLHMCQDGNRITYRRRDSLAGRLPAPKSR